jgi:HK97 family phage prohead protease
VELSAFFDAYDEVPNQRSAQFADLEVKEASGGGLLFDGLAAVFGEPTDLGDFTEEFRHGAFRKVLATGANVPLLHEHKPEYLLATTQSGRMRLFEEARGLRVSASLADTDLSRRIKALVESGDVRGMSVGFICGRGNSEHSYQSGKPHRIIKNLKKLLDVTTTWDPAYASAEAQFRSMTIADPESTRPLQQLLMGVYPTQLENGQLPEDEEETRSSDEVDESEDPSGVSGTPLLAARKRRLHLLTLTLEGGDPDAD